MHSFWVFFCTEYYQKDDYIPGYGHDRTNCKLQKLLTLCEMASIFEYHFKSLVAVWT